MVCDICTNAPISCGCHFITHYAVGCAAPPSPQMQKVLFRSKFFFVVQYLQGSPLVAADLVRAKASQAKAIMFMTNKFSSNPDQEDAKTIMQLYSVRRYLCNSAELQLPFLCLQVILPENTQKLLHESNAEHKDHIVCLNKMRMGVIAKTCMFPGTSTLLFNLLHSFTYDTEDHEGLNTDIDDSLSKDGSVAGSPAAFGKKMMRGVSTDSSKDDMSCPSVDDEEEDLAKQMEDNCFFDWEREYKLGAGWEIYITEICGRFSGYPFINLAAALYRKLGVVLFALRVKELKGRKSQRVLLNPADYIIPPRTECRVEGFVIAEDSLSADLSFNKKTIDETEGEGGPEGRRGSSVGGFISTITKSIDRGSKYIRRRASSIRRGNRAQLEQAAEGKLRQGLVNPYKTRYDPSLSAQERKQQMVDENMKVNFFVLDEHVDMQSITIATSLLKEYPSLRNHIIVTGKSLHNLFDFILPLREKKRGKFRPIVILHPHRISYHVWGQISIFAGIYFVRGSPVVERDIRRAGVYRASHFVLLAGADTEKAEVREVGSRQTGLEDADAIFSYHIVRRLNDKTKIIVEMVHPQNSSYLEPVIDVNTSNNVDGEDYIVSPLFASGSMFTASLLDTFVCQVCFVLFVASEH